MSKTRALPKAFTEKELYLLAIILLSNRATQTTIAIMETFSKIKELSQNVKELQVIVYKDENKILYEEVVRLLQKYLMTI